LAEAQQLREEELVRTILMLFLAVNVQQCLSVCHTDAMHVSSQAVSYENYRY